MQVTETAQALFYTAPGVAELRQVALAPLAPGEVEVRTLYSALSRGTERLVSAGAVPPGEYTAMRAPHQQGDFPFPVKYGYAAVGVAVAGPDALVGRHVFSLYPHQDVPAARAVLGANAETALNAIWDGGVLPAERVLVLGAGLLGCLIAAFLSRIHANVSLTDKLAEPAAIVADFPVNIVSVEALADDYDVIFHTTASAAGLQTAIGALAFEGRVVELSWFGDRPVELMLGGAFHSRRLSIRASQVGHVAPARRATTTRRDRLAEALALLDDARFDRLITGEVAFADLAHEIPRLLAPGAAGIATRIRYA